MSKRKNPLKILAEDCGYDSVHDLLAAIVSEQINPPGWCTTCKSNTDDVEPDATANWCPECEQQTLVSPLIIAGII